MFNISDVCLIETIDTGNKVKSQIETRNKGFGWKGCQYRWNRLNRSTIGSIDSKKRTKNITLLIGQECNKVC